MTHPKTLLITGANSGIGAELAKQYSAPGVTLYLSARRLDRLEEVAALCRAKGAEVVVRACDVTDRDAMRDWVIFADEATPLDMVIANAGLGGADSISGQYGEPEEAIRRMFAINTDGVLNTIEPLKPRMVARQSGQIVLVSSLASYFGMPDGPAYCGSKAAIRVYGEGLRPVLKDQGVKVNVVCPGFVKTPMSDQLPFELPFLMSVEKATRLIIKKLAKDRARISFPSLLAFGSWFGMVLPPFICGPIMARFRKMPHRPGEELERRS